jgi:hypothetical protein
MLEGVGVLSLSGRLGKTEHRPRQQGLDATFAPPPRLRRGPGLLQRPGIAPGYAGYEPARGLASLRV